jgi:hypothetical protein
MNSLEASEMSREQYAWGLSNGVTVLTISGVFWLSLAAWTIGFGILLITVPLALLVAGILIGPMCVFAVASPSSLRGVFAKRPRAA